MFFTIKTENVMDHYHAFSFFSSYMYKKRDDFICTNTFSKNGHICSPAVELEPFTEGQ